MNEQSKDTYKMDKKEIVPDLKIVLNNETKYWRDIPEVIDQIYGIYLYDANLNIHICSFQGSFEAWFMQYYWTCERFDVLTDEQIRIADDYLMGGYEEPVQYYTGLDKNKLQQSIDIEDIAEWEGFNPKDTLAVREHMDDIITALQPNAEAETIAYQLLNK